MGTLIAFRYPTNLMARLADHTYVACGTLGKAWACWGGKTGGTELRRAPGSTRRADAIAEPNERARITCYLINGVCHQAANRILLPAGITVQGARGYWVSTAMFGTYGRPHGVFGLCKAPFNRHAGVGGDLEACIEAGRSRDPRDRDPVGTSASPPPAELTDPAFQAYLRLVEPLHDVTQAQMDALPEFARIEVLIEAQVQEFAAMVDLRLGDGTALKTAHGQALLDLRGEIERERIALEERWAHGEIEPKEFAAAFDALTLRFQAETAARLDGETYFRLFSLPPDEPVTLADPEIAAHALSARPEPDGFTA